MKILTSFILVLSGLWPIAVHAQDDNALAQINAKVLAINNAKGLMLKILSGDEVNAGEPYEMGGSLTGYYRNDSLVKVSLWAGLTYELWICDYYFDNGQLIYANEKQKPYVWDSANKVFDYNHTTLKTDIKYYLAKNELIKKTVNGSPAELPVSGKQATQNFLSYTAEYYRRMQQSPNKKIKAD